MAVKKKTTHKPSMAMTDQELQARWQNDADRFKALADEIYENLKHGRYHYLKFTFSEARRKAIDAMPGVAADGKPRAPIDMKTTYSGRPWPAKG